MNPPKVLVGCPTAEIKDYCLKEYVDGLKALTYPNKDFLIVDNSQTGAYAEKIKGLGIPVVRDAPLEDVKERIAHSRNVLRDKALKEGYDYFLSLEQDVIPPADVIERLLKASVKVITGVYFTIYTFDGAPKMRPLVWKADPARPGQRMFMNAEVKAAQGKASDVQPISASGVGCILIHRDVFEKIRFRVANDTYDDMPFCDDCVANDFRVYADVALVCKHIVDMNGQKLVLPA